MKLTLLSVRRPEIAPVCRKVYDLFSTGQIKVAPGELEIFGTRILFSGNPVPNAVVVGNAVHLTWRDGAKIDVDRLPDRLDPSVQRLEVYHDRAVVVTGYGRVVLES